MTIEPNTITFHKIEPNTITFHNNADWVMRITADRRIEVNEDVEVTDAAKKVLDAMQYLLKAQRTWSEGREQAFSEIAEKMKLMPWGSDTMHSFLIWLGEQK